MKNYKNYIVTGTVSACLGLFCLAGPAAAQNAKQNAKPIAQQTEGAAPAGQQVAGDVRKGHSLFLKDGCRQCHGTVGQGGGGGPRLAPDPLPVEAIEAYVRSPAGQMPPFGAKVLSHEDIVNIHAYLASVMPPPAVKDIPALNVD